MEAAQWTAVALVAGSAFGSFLYVGSRIDNLGARADDLGSSLDQCAPAEGG